MLLVSINYNSQYAPKHASDRPCVSGIYNREKYKAYILKYKALISKYMPYILGALHFFEIQQYIRLPNRAFFLTYRQLKKLFCRASFL